jgi:uncharacterized protein (TIGR02996 family)
VVKLHTPGGVLIESLPAGNNDFETVTKQMHDTILSGCGVPGHLLGEDRRFNSDLDRLIWSVLLNPADDTLRLVCADAFEEADQADRATLIRWQVGGEQGPCLLREHKPPDLTWLTEHWVGITDTFDGARTFCSEGNRVRLGYVRGFVTHLYLPLELFTQHAGKIFSTHPAASVWLSDRVPLAGVNGLTLWRRDANVWDTEPMDEQYLQQHRRSLLPDALFDLLVSASGTRYSRYYDRASAAYEELSRVCVQHGRRLAGLPS